MSLIPGMRQADRVRLRVLDLSESDERLLSWIHGNDLFKFAGLELGVETPEEQGELWRPILDGLDVAPDNLTWTFGELRRAIREAAGSRGRDSEEVFRGVADVPAGEQLADDPFFPPPAGVPE